MCCSHMSLQPGIDPFRLHANRASSAYTRVTELAALTCRVDCVSADARVLGSFGNVHPDPHNSSDASACAIAMTWLMGMRRQSLWTCGRWLVHAARMRASDADIVTTGRNFLRMGVETVFRARHIHEASAHLRPREFILCEGPEVDRCGFECSDRIRRVSARRTRRERRAE